MKRILLSLTLLIFAGSLFSQSLSLIYEGNPIAHGSQVMVFGEPTAEYIQARVNVKNNAAAALQVKVKKIIAANDTLPGTTNYFCWGLCFLPTTYISPNNISIDPGATNEEFYGDYNPNNIPGSSKVTYVFFDMNNTNDSVAVTVEYKASPASVGENLLKSVKMSEVYPNPALTTANIDYSLPSGVSRAEIVLTNMLGCRVGQVTLPETSGKARIPVSDLLNGVYFYSLVVDGQVAKTGKFIVKK